MNLEQRIKDIATGNQVPLLGFSDLTPAMDYICTQGGEQLRNTPYCITLGMAIPQEIMEAINDPKDIFAVPNYLYAYQAANQILGNVAFSISNLLQQEKFSGVPIPPAVYDRQGLVSCFSHKVGARLSGLGWIGKSGMLVTEDYGTRVRLCSVLTDAPLMVNQNPPMESKCGSCTACVKACPVNAYKNRAFDPSEPREMRFDAFACNGYHRKLENEGKIDLCGYCVSACPYGKKAKKAGSERVAL